MCGVFGYASEQEKDVFGVIHKGLKRLEYRGYDSWGISVVVKDKIKTYKTTNSLDKKPKGAVIKGKTGIGHTRWATHGNVTAKNAHPHLSTYKDFALAQNGIVENFQQLKDFLIDRGYDFKTETDTEVIVKLIEHHLKEAKNFEDAVITAFKKLKGRNTIIILTRQNAIIAIKNGSPLTVGLGENEFFFSSDTLSYSPQTTKAVILNDLEMVVYHKNLPDKLKFLDLKTQKVIHKEPINTGDQNNKIDKEGFDHFMLKEIIEQKEVVLNATNYHESDFSNLTELIKANPQIYTVGAGTAGFAAGQLAYLLRSIAGVRAVELKAYEVESYQKLFNHRSVLMAISQSGETADTLEAIKLAKSKKTRIVSLVNMMGSTMSRESDLPFYLKAGPEICVVSTKAFTGQLAWSYLLAQSLNKHFDSAQKTLKTTSKKLGQFLQPALFKQMKTLAQKLAKQEHIFILGRGQNYYIAQEGALKIKETSYKHAEAFSAGELKHGVIALIEKDTPVICVVSEDAEKDTMLNAAHEIKARGGQIIAVAKENNEIFDEFIKVPNGNSLDFLFNVIPFQLLGYYLCLIKGHDPDKPRNLAKSVTVK